MNEIKIAADPKTDLSYVQIVLPLWNNDEVCTTAYIDQFGRVIVDKDIVKAYLLTLIKEMR